MRYIDCTLTIKTPQSVSIEYVDGKLTRQRDGRLIVDKVDMLTVERLNYWINYGLQMQAKIAQQSLAKDRGIPRNENPTRLDDLKLIGLILYKILFSDPLIEQGFQAAYDDFYRTYSEEQSSSQSADLRLRLKLVFEEHLDMLSNLPWEFLFIPGKGKPLEGNFFSGQQTEMLLARYVPRSKLVSELSAKQEQLRILVVIYNLSGMGGFEEDETKDLLSKMQSIPHVEVSILNNLTYQELSDMINLDSISRASHPTLYAKLAIASGMGDPEDKEEKETKRQWDPIPNPPYHILHFVGHGEAEGLYLIKDPNDDDYDAERGRNQPWHYTAEQFRRIFSNTRRKPRMIFLHACKGDTPSHEGFKSTARQLVYAEIPAVVAMQYSISHRDAGIFARKFYEELGKGKEIDEAVKEGRMELGRRTPPWEHPRFGTPVVYLQSEIANELVKPAPELEKEMERGPSEPGTISGGLPRVGGSAGGESPAVAKTS